MVFAIPKPMKLQCPHCSQRRNPQNAIRTIRRMGYYYRKSDGQYLTRLWCFGCRKSFSAATISPARGQKKRHLNRIILKLHTGAVSQREAARILGVNKKTIVRKVRYGGRDAYAQLQRDNAKFPKSISIQFDDLETFIHTKLKPVSVVAMVESESRRILGYRVAQMPAKGRLAALSRKKYGPRPDDRGQARRELFQEMRQFVADDALIKSDASPFYPADVKEFFPEALHQTTLGGRAAIVGQGELKKKSFDPIFSLNHTFAMYRDHLKRLGRRTWCTTKRMEGLQIDLALYALEHNARLRKSTG